MKEVFTEIVGNAALCRRFGDDVLNGKLPHAVILEGLPGTGKHILAKMTAAALVCEKKSDDRQPLPCLACPSCKKVLENKSPDVITVGCDGKATVGVDTVRFLREDVHVIPNDSEHKIYLIEHADKMTVQAQNALLLTLEEPPSYVHFFLLCQNAGLLLETIRSRAPTFRTEPIEREAIDRYLCAHFREAAQMKQTDPGGYAELLMASEAGIGQALAFLDTKTFAPIRQRRELCTELIDVAVRQKRARAVLPLISRFSVKRDLLQEQLFSLSCALRDLILLKKSDSVSLMFYADREYATELCDRAPLSFLYQFYEAVRLATEENSKNANVRMLLMKMAQNADLL